MKTDKLNPYRKRLADPTSNSVARKRLFNKMIAVTQETAYQKSVTFAQPLYGRIKQPQSKSFKKIRHDLNNDDRYLEESVKNKYEEIDKRLQHSITKNNSHYFIAESFDRIIENDPNFSKLLNQIKQFYDKQVLDMNLSALAKENEQLKKTKDEKSAQLQLKLDEVKKINTKNHELNTDTEKFRSVISQKEEKLTDIKEQLQSITEIDISNLYKNSETWHTLNTQIKEYSQFIKSTKKLYTISRKSRKDLQRQISLMKMSGIPIEEIYMQDIDNYK